MIRNISHNDKEIRKEINDLVGPPFPMRTRLKMRGIGSPRYTIREASKKLTALLERDSNTPVANIELRPRGVIMGFRSRLDSYAWALPYHALQIFKNDGVISVYGGEDYMKLEVRDNFRDQGRFIRRKLQLKAEYAASESPLF